MGLVMVNYIKLLFVDSFKGDITAIILLLITIILVAVILFLMILVITTSILGPNLQEVSTVVNY